MSQQAFKDMPKVAIIGAGLAGMQCARALLEGGIEPRLFDKGRGIGGRCATRRQPERNFDHGVPYLSAEQAAIIQPYLPANTSLTSWIKSTKGEQRTHYLTAPSMNHLAKKFAEPLRIERQKEVLQIERNAGNRWILHLADPLRGRSRTEAFDAILITAPSTQAEKLLASAAEPALHRFMEPLQAVRFDPIWAGMAIYAQTPDKQAARTDTFFECHDIGLGKLIAEYTKPGRLQPTAASNEADDENRTDAEGPSDGTAYNSETARSSTQSLLTTVSSHFVMHATPAWSLANLELSEAAAKEAFAKMLQQVQPEWDAGAELMSLQTHRWRYARCSKPLSVGSLYSADHRVGLAGDWCLGDSIEHALASGAHLAKQFLAG